MGALAVIANSHNTALMFIYIFIVRTRYKEMYAALLDAERLGRRSHAEFGNDDGCAGTIKNKLTGKI